MALLGSSILLKHLLDNIGNRSCYLFGRQVYLSNVPFSTKIRWYNTTDYHKSKPLNQLIKKMEDFARQGKFIGRNQIEQLMQAINREEISSVHSLHVLKFFGDIMAEEEPTVRTKLALKLWKSLESKAKVDIAHYNMLLGVFLENGHPISAEEALADLKSRNLEPNRATFQKIISNYGERGDLVGLAQTMEIMKDRGMTLNDRMYNALILAHGLAGETEKAFQLLPTMKDLGFSVTNETYAALLRAHAKHGDVNAILSEIERLKTKRIYLKDRDILNLIYDLSVNGYGEKAACLMDLFVKNEGFVRAATNTVIRLVNAEQFDVVIKLLKTFPIKAYATGKNVNIGGFVLKQLVRHNRSRDEIMSICKQMEEEGLHSSPYSVVESQSMEIQPGPSHRIWTAIYASKIKATPLTEYNFRPLFFTCNDSEAQGIVRKMITEFKITPSLQFLVTNVLPKLNYQPVDATINKLLGLNVPASLAALAVVYQCLERNDLKNAADILNHFKLHVPVAIFKPLLISALTSTDDVRSFVLFLCINHKNLQHSKSVRKSGTDKTSESVSEISNEHNDRKINNFWSRIMCDTFTKLIGDERSTTIEAILKNLVEQGVTISTSEADRIKSEIQNFVTDDMIKHLDKLASGELQLHSIEKSNIRTKPNSIRLEKIISETKVEDKSSEYFELLKAYHREGEYEKYEMLVQRLETESVQIPSTVHERLIDIRLKAGDLKDSLALFDKHRAENKDFYLYKQTLTKMTSMLIENQQFNEALIVLQKSRKSKEFIADYWDCEQYFLLLTKLADGGKITELNQLFDCLLENRHIIVSNKLLGPLVKVHLVNKNLSKAVEVFESLAKRFHVTPLKNILFTQLIIAEDPTNIQRVQEISSSVHGMHNVLTDLAICYIECGYIDEAQHLFDNANVYPAQRIIMGNADRYLKEGFAFHLEKLLLVTKYWKNVKEEPIRMHLLQLYIQRNQLEKVKEMYATLQDENIIPSKEFLSTMNNYFYLQNEYASSFQKPIPRKVPVPKHSNQNQTDRIDASDIK